MACSPFGAAAPLSHSLQSADSHELLVIHQDCHNNLIRAREAIDSLAWLVNEIHGKSLGHPCKDAYLNIPAEGLSSLLWCIHETMGVDDSATVCKVLRHRPELATN